MEIMAIAAMETAGTWYVKADTVGVHSKAQKAIVSTNCMVGTQGGREFGSVECSDQYRTI